MAVETYTLSLSTKGDGDIIDITPRLKELIAGGKITDGIVTVFVTGATGAITTLEYEPGLVKDLPAALERLAPRGAHYEHNARWGDENGFSHVRASLLGPSLTIPLNNGAFHLGRWQQVVFVECDNRPRSRELLIQVVGE